MEVSSESKTLVLKFEGYNPSPFFNLRKIMVQEKEYLATLLKDHDFIYYGEKDTEPTNTFGLMGLFRIKSPIKAGAASFVEEILQPNVQALVY